MSIRSSRAISHPPVRSPRGAGRQEAATSPTCPVEEEAPPGRRAVTSAQQEEQRATPVQTPGNHTVRKSTQGAPNIASVRRTWGSRQSSSSTAASRKASSASRHGASSGPKRTQGVPGELEQQATDESEQQSDVLRARQIYANMAADRRLTEERIRATWADVQTEILRIWQEVLLRRQKVMADLLDKWSKVLFG